MINPLLYIAVLLIILVVIVITIYNKLVRSRNQIENAISSLDAIFIKRSELLPNLIELVKKHMNYEESVLEKITALRSTRSNSNPTIEKQANQAVKGIMVQLEAYPELKSNTQFSQLQESWNEIEEQISAGRRYVSSSITVYNNNVKTFPANLLAKTFGMTTHNWEYASSEEKKSINAKDLF